MLEHQVSATRNLPPLIMIISNVAAGNNCNSNNTPSSTQCLAGLTHQIYNMEGRIKEKKGDFPVLEIDTIATEVEGSGAVFFKYLKSGVIESEKPHSEIAAAIGSMDVTNQSTVEFKTFDLYILCLYINSSMYDEQLSEE